MESIKKFVDIRTLVLASVIVYLIAFFPLYNAVGWPAWALSMMPVLVAGGMLGMRGGIITVFLLYIIGIFLSIGIGLGVWDGIFQGLPGLLIMLLIGATVGRMRDMDERIKLELSERRRAEEELMKFKLGIERAKDGIFMTKTDGTIVYVNPAFEKIYGYGRDEVFGKTPRFLRSESLPEEFYKKLWSPLLMKNVISTEFVNKTKDGKMLNIDASVNPILNETGDIMGFLAIHRDITEKKNMEKISLENERLMYANRAKSEFLAAMSHELRTPMNSILGFSELLKQNKSGELNEKQLHYAENIIISGRTLLALIDDVLDLTQMEAGKIELNIERFDIGGAMDEVIPLFEEKAAKGNVVLNKEFEPMLSIEADRTKIKQIFFNLLSNAVKFSKKEGGTITISTKKEGDTAKISVSDTGIGIREKDLEKLFMKFQQIDSGISRTYGGTGLGLAISKQLASLHGGNILVESTYGQGSTFTLIMPLVNSTNLN